MMWLTRIKERGSGLMGAVAKCALDLVASVAHRVGTPTLLGVPVSAAILSRVAVVQSEQQLDEVAQLFVAGRHDLLPVVDHGKPVAVITRRDVAAGLESVGPHAPVTAAPSHDVITVAPSDSLADVLERLHAAPPDAVAVVVDRGGPVGLVTAEGLQAYLDSTGRA